MRHFLLLLGTVFIFESVFPKNVCAAIRLVFPNEWGIENAGIPSDGSPVPIVDKVTGLPVAHFDTVTGTFSVTDVGKNFGFSGGKNLTLAGGTSSSAPNVSTATPGVNGAPTSMEGAAPKPPEELSPEQLANADADAEVYETVETEEAAAQASKTISWNYGQHALLIMEALTANDIEDATKEVTVKAAEMQESQGGQCDGASEALAAMNTPMPGTTIADSAEILNTLLDMNKIDLGLLSTDIDKPKEELTGLAAAAGKSAADVSATGQSTSGDEESLTTEEEREIRRRRALLLSEWATAATQIGEGSNAISRAFYDRASAFAEVANGAQGSLGGISAIADTDRFVLFEITRGAALSAIGLGLQGATNLNDLEEAKREVKSSDNMQGLSAAAGRS